MNTLTYLQIPEQLKVGFKNNKTSLGYVTYLKDDNSIAKETSWNNWRSKDVPVLDIKNTPISGIKIKDWGGGHRWTRRQAFCQIIDPRGFECQISFDNLMFILLTNSCIDGEFQGEYVYGWDNTTMVLTSVKSEDYIYSQKINNEVQRFNPKECVVGHTYYYPKNPTLKMVFLGKFPYVNCIDKIDHSNWGAGATLKDTVKIKIENRYIFKYLENSNYKYFEYLNASLLDKNKLVCCDSQPVASDVLEDYINEYYSLQTTNVNTLTTKKVAIEKFNIIGEDITDEIESYKVYPTDEWTEAFMKESSAGNIYNNQRVCYISDDHKTIYIISLKKCCDIPKYGDMYHYLMFGAESTRLFKDLQTDEDKFNYLKTHGKYSLKYYIHKILSISEDNSCIECIRPITCRDDKLNDINKLTSSVKGRFILVNRNYQISPDIRAVLNENREVKMDTYCF